MALVRWKLDQLLKEHGLRPREVESEALRLGYGLGRNTIYRLLREDGPMNVNRNTLATLIASLRSLTDQPIVVEDLLEYGSVETRDIVGGGEHAA
jgi:hypothetical protein